MTIGLSSDDATFEQIKKQLNRCVEVIKLNDITVTGRYDLNAPRLNRGDKVKVLIKKLYTISGNETKILLNKGLDASDAYYI